jgi:RHS repeat-associated protein
VIGSAIDLRFEYDPAERLIRTRDAKVASRDLELFSWDCVRFNVTQPCATATHAGQLAASARYNYDTELGTIAVTQANQYDPVTGRLLRRDHSVGNGEVGGVTRFTGESFFFSQNYNDLGLIHTVTYPCRVSSTECVAGDPGRSIQHGYLNGQLKSVGTWASNMTYRANGTIDTITHGSGPSAVLEKWEADPHGMARPRRIYSTNAAGTQELRSSGNYAFDGSGNVKTIGNTSYAYDPFGRLMSWTATGASGSYSTTTRGYDDFGNYLYTMESGCGPAPQSKCYSTSFLPRDIQGTTNRYVDTIYDTAGNVTLDSDRRAYTWDPLGMMTTATADGRTFRYIYTAGNERIAAVERVPVASVLRNRTTFTLRGTGNQLLSTWTDDWTSGSRVFTRKEDTIWRGSQLLARAAGATAMNYALDHLGSPRLITNSAGAVLDQQHFEPFGGGGLFGSGALQFTGHERDRANLGGGAINLPDYMHARFYDPGLGRFISVDPVLEIEKTIPQPQKWNRYAYVLNNPMKYTDPNGREENLVGGGTMVNSSSQTVYIAFDGQMGTRSTDYVIPLKPGESSEEFTFDADAVVIGPDQNISGATGGSFKVSAGSVEIKDGKNGSLVLTGSPTYFAMKNRSNPEARSGHQSAAQSPQQWRLTSEKKAETDKQRQQASSTLEARREQKKAERWEKIKDKLVFWR